MGTSVNVTQSSTCKLCSTQGPATGPALATTSTATTGSTSTRSFSHDADGNITSITGWGNNRTFSYDAFNRLASVTTGAGSTSYLYNALGQRARKTGAGGTVTSTCGLCSRILAIGYSSPKGSHESDGAERTAQRM